MNVVNEIMAFKCKVNFKFYDGAATMMRWRGWRHLFWKGWGFKFVCYSLVLLTSALCLFEPIARVVAKESIFSQDVNQTVTTTQNSIIVRQFSESSLIRADSLQKVICLPKHQQSELFNHLTTESLHQSQVELSQSKSKKSTEAKTQVLIAEVVIRSKKGNLEDKLIDEVYRVIRTKPGHCTTLTQLQEDINTIFATGYVSNVQAIPKDTPLGVQLTFEVIPNPILRQIELSGSVLKVLLVKGKKISLKQAIDNIFAKQYGQVLNLGKLQAGIKQFIQLYQNNGYVLANFTGSPKVQENGTVILDVAEGIIEQIQVKFLKKDSEKADENSTLVKGITPVSQILNKFAVEPGKVYNNSQIKASLKQISSLELSEDLNIILNPGKDSRKVVVVINIINEYTKLQRVAKRALDAQKQNKRLDAINEFQTVLRLTQLSQSKLEEALTFSNLGNLYKEEGEKSSSQQDYQQARNAYSQALTLFKKFNVRYMEEITLINLAEVYRKLNEPDQALDYYSQALHLLRSIKEKPNAADLIGSLTKNNPLNFLKNDIVKYFSLFKPYVEIGLVFDLTIAYAVVGDYQQAIYLLSDEYPVLQNIFNKLNDELKYYLKKEKNTNNFYEKYSNEIHQTMLLLPDIFVRLPYYFIYFNLGNELRGATYKEEARQKFLNLLQIWKESVANKQPDKATSDIKSIVVILDWFFNNQKDSQQLTLQIQQISELLNSLIDKKDFQKFTPYLQPLTSLFISLFTQSNDDEKLVSILSQAVSLWNSLGRENTEKFDWAKSFVFNIQGAAYYRLGKYREALSAYRQALDSLNLNLNNDKSSFTSTLQILIPGLKARILLALGKVYDALGKPENAFTFYRQALDLPTKFKSSLLEAEAHYGIAKFAWFHGNISEAQKQIETTVIKSENSSVRFTNLASGSGFTTLNYSYGYGLKGRSSVGVGLAVSSSTLEFTTDTAKFDPGNPCDTLAAYFGCRQKYFESYISLLMQRYQQTASKEYKIQAFQASERARTLTAQAFQDSGNIQTNQQSNSQRGDKSANLRARIPGRIRPAKLSEIQQQLLDNHTLLLEYFLGEEKSYLWVVSRNSIETYSLPKRLTIEAKAKEFYDLLTTPTGRVRPRTTATVGKELSEMILGPVARQLRQKRLLIVGDGVLQYIPFNALPELKPINNVSHLSPEGEFTPYMQPLLVNHEVINLLSASAMIEVRQNHSDRQTPRMELAVFADPVFNREDERVSRTFSTTNTTAASHNSISDLEAIYPSLPGTKQEVQQILKFIPPDKRSQFLGFDASYQAALGSKLNQYRIIHFATHGFFNIKSPERSGVVLSIMSKTGELQRGSIRPASTLNMDLSAADLVVLSGCRTGLKGDLIREGLTGITGGLMSAGAERLVASLWSVNDEATAKLMTLFYQNMFEKKLSPTKALRSAQLSFWQDSRWQTPYNWAAFTIYGEWK